MILSIFLFIFAVIGLTDIIIESEIAKPFIDWIKEKIIPEKIFKDTRFETKLHTIFSCHQCCGLWSGFVLSPFIFGFVTNIFSSKILTFLVNLPFWFLVCGAAGSAIASWSFMLKEYILSQTTYQFNGDDNGSPDSSQ